MGMHACMPCAGHRPKLPPFCNARIFDPVTRGAGLIVAGHADAAPRAGGRPAATPAAATKVVKGSLGEYAPGPPRKDAPKYAPNFVLVQLKPAAAAAAATGAAKAPALPGLQLSSFVGEHHTIKVPASGGPAVAAAAAAKAPANAVMKFRITDGSSVEAKVKQLKANPGAGAAAACHLSRCVAHSVGACQMWALH